MCQSPLLSMKNQSVMPIKMPLVHTVGTLDQLDDVSIVQPKEQQQQTRLNNIINRQ